MTPFQTFQEAIDQVILEDPRYPRDAYFFIREGFDAAIQRLSEKENLPPEQRPRHPITGKELSFQLKEYALDLYGPMAAFVLNEWNIHSTSDFGNLVFNLVEAGIFAQNKGDKKSDFDNLFDLMDELQKPYR